jgi:hypothetical protein
MPGVRVLQLFVTGLTAIVLVASSSGPADPTLWRQGAYSRYEGGRLLGRGAGPAVGAGLLLGFVWIVSGSVGRAALGEPRGVRRPGEPAPAPPPDAGNPFAPPEPREEPDAAPVSALSRLGGRERAPGFVPPAGLDPIAHLTFQTPDEGAPPPLPDAYDTDDPHHIVISNDERDA